MRLVPLLVGTVIGIWLTPHVDLPLCALRTAPSCSAVCWLFSHRSSSHKFASCRAQRRKMDRRHRRRHYACFSNRHRRAVSPRCRSGIRSAWERTNWCRALGCSSTVATVALPLISRAGAWNGAASDRMARARDRHGGFLHRHVFVGQAVALAGCTGNLPPWFLIPAGGDDTSRLYLAGKCGLISGG